MDDREGVCLSYLPFFFFFENENGNTLFNLTDGLVLSKLHELIHTQYAVPVAMIRTCRFF
jgi:hypothetical protein